MTKLKDIKEKCKYCGKEVNILLNCICILDRLGIKKSKEEK